ncbi:MAG: 5'/3'-nucleotidase SurE [Myxococcota bacterium]
MLILISNDDGVHAPGLAALASAATALGDVYVVAPATEQSARSHGLTMHDPLRVRPLGDQRYSVTGTPADSVYLALNHLLPRAPDLVLSGINRGSNLGSDVHYSGTVAAAREAALNNIPALAVSLSPRSRDESRYHYDVAAEVAVEVARNLAADPPPHGIFLNLNVPDLPREQILGIRPAPLCERMYAPLVQEGRDPRNRPYYWIGGPARGFGGGDHTDGALVERGFATLSPMRLDPTAYEEMARLWQWFPNG